MRRDCSCILIGSRTPYETSAPSLPRKVVKRARAFEEPISLFWHGHLDLLTYSHGETETVNVVAPQILHGLDYTFRFLSIPRYLAT